MGTDIKPKLSRKAVLALVVPVTQWLIASLFCVLHIFHPFAYPLAVITAVLAFSLPIVGIILFILAIRALKKSNGSLSGYRFAAEGLILSVILCIFLLQYISYAEHYSIPAALH